MPGQLSRLKSRRRKTISEVRISRKVCLKRTNCQQLLNILYLLDFATFPRCLRQGKDQRKGQRCPRRQWIAVKRALMRRETLTSAVNARRLRAGRDAPRLHSLKDERAKKTRTGTAVGWTTAWKNSSRWAWSARKAEATSSPTMTVIRFFLWSISLETWTLCRWGDEAFLQQRSFFVLCSDGTRTSRL